MTTALTTKEAEELRLALLAFIQPAVAYRPAWLSFIGSGQGKAKTRGCQGGLTFVDKVSKATLGRHIILANTNAN